MRKRVLAVKLVLALALLVANAAATITLAAKPQPGPGPGPIGGGCPKDIYCLDVWDPVVCADGITYSNQCYADRACAPKPCSPAGDR